MSTLLILFRRDRENKRYIGSICGLGVDRDQRHSLFPEHDMEITFDVEIDNKDISQVIVKNFKK